MPKGMKIAIVDDEKDMRQSISQWLALSGFDTESFATAEEALKRIGADYPGVVVSDVRMPGMDGMSFLKRLMSQDSALPVIIITGHGDVHMAVRAMKSGAVDFIEKPFSADRLAVTLKNALRRQNLEEFVDMHRRDHFHGFVGSSLCMITVYHIIDSVAASKATVFLNGESGTGKVVCAQAIHEASPRHDKPFVALNCAAIPRDLMESEIFGHTKGAFTGAVTAREGAAARADGGTLFLDEICEMDMDLQSKLLRFIQTSSFQKVGSNTLQTVDIRFVCATNRDPMEEVRAGRFREDLYYRLNVLNIVAPPLRKRGSDVLLLADYFLEKYTSESSAKRIAGFSPDARVAMQSWHWPGNVRELLNKIKKAIVMCERGPLTR